MEVEVQEDGPMDGMVVEADTQPELPLLLPDQPLPWWQDNQVSQATTVELPPMEELDPVRTPTTVVVVEDQPYVPVQLT